MALMMGPVKVESLKDPLEIGRVLGRRIYYDGTKKDIPTDKLCKVVVCTPATGIGAQNIGGSGVSPVGLREGATILGLWDTDNPELVYAVGGVPTDSGKNGKVQSSGAPGSLTSIRTATPGTTGPHTAPFKAQSKASKEVHPKQPQYVTIPGEYTKTFSTKSDSGMFFILHDVKGKTFYSVVHPSGTFTEMQSDGSIAETVTGNKKTSVDGEYTLGSDGNFAMFSNHSMEIRVKDTLTIKAKNVVWEVGENVKETIGGSKTETISESHSETAKGITLNSKAGIGLQAQGDVVTKGLTTKIQNGGETTTPKTFI